jgi:Ftsk gamma domain
MAEQQKSSRTALASRELIGMALFTLSAFPLVLVGYALVKGGQPAAGGTAAIAARIVGAVGYLPAIVGAGGFALVGGGMALSGRDLQPGRHLAGFLFTALGLAVCLGALRESGQGLLHGGAFGDATGGALRAIGVWAGLVIGGSVAAASVWLTWLGGSVSWAGGRFRGNAVQNPTLTDALSEKDSDGVSSAEANALVPDEATLSYMEELWQEANVSQPVPQPAPIPPSPYPDDVRTRGEVPEGATPLASDDDPNEDHYPAETGAPSWSPAPAVSGSHDSPGDDLAGQGMSGAVQVTFGAGAAVQGDSTGSAGPELGAGPVATPAGARALVDDLAESLEGPPPPAWEQPALFSEAPEPEPSVELEEEEDEQFEEEEEEELEAELEEEEEDEEEEDEEAEAELEEDEEDDEEEEDDDEYEVEDELEEEEEDDEEYEEEEEEEEEQPEPLAAEEPEVVLQPTAPPADAVPPEQLVKAAGLLFLEHGRVAVSLLQRKFSIDFDEACVVLDDLQELGLIGPYLGGQKRDILLTTDEWEGRLAGS